MFTGIIWWELVSILTENFPLSKTQCCKRGFSILSRFPINYFLCVQSIKKNGEQPHYFQYSLSYRMNFCLLQFDAIKLLLVVFLRGGSLPTSNFFSVNPEIWQRNHKVNRSNCLNTIFYNIFDINFPSCFFLFPFALLWLESTSHWKSACCFLISWFTSFLLSCV